MFSISSKTAVGSFTTGIDIQHLAVNSDFIFTATKCGTIEVWLKERVTRVASVKANNSGGGHAKITCMVADNDVGMLYAGSSDGKIQVVCLIDEMYIYTIKSPCQIVILTCTHLIFYVIRFLQAWTLE